MSVFVLKLLAVASMLVDHLGYYLRPSLSPSAYTAMRSVGRFAFPVYCFLIVNGYQHTRDVKRYLTRLVAFAVVSQLPYALFHAEPAAGEALAVSLGSRWFVCLIFIAVAGIAWFTTVRRDGSVVWPVLALGLAVLRVDYGGVRILTGDLNVFYTLSLGLSVIAVLDAALKPERDVIKLLMQAMGLFGAFLLIGDSMDYGVVGVALIVALWAARGSKYSQAAMILLWGGVKYLAGGTLLLTRFAGVACAAAAVLLYNRRLGRPLKLAFYAVYPAHLLILGMLIIYRLLA